MVNFLFSSKQTRPSFPRTKYGRTGRGGCTASGVRLNPHVQADQRVVTPAVATPLLDSLPHAVNDDATEYTERTPTRKPAKPAAEAYLPWVRLGVTNSCCCVTREAIRGFGGFGFGAFHGFSWRLAAAAVWLVKGRIGADGGTPVSRSS
jgi:hypothetical protein